MKRFGFLMFICVAMFLVGCAEDTTPEKINGDAGGAAESQQGGKGEAQTKTEIFNIGDSVKAGDLVFTVNSTRTDNGNDIFKPAEGSIFYIVDVTIENTGNESEAVSSLMMFNLFDSEGYNYTVTIGPETRGQVDGEIMAGRKLRGELVFEIPENAESLELEIDPTLSGSGKIRVALDK